ncbi:MAG: hypothetical protein E6Q97_12325 [Desulfurellales bacterium]|nr:MAG: hypothetical protein E6Q97_12325 [Desulfurellales bacterium]
MTAIDMRVIRWPALLTCIINQRVSPFASDDSGIVEAFQAVLINMPYEFKRQYDAEMPVEAAKDPECRSVVARTLLGRVLDEMAYPLFAGGSVWNMPEMVAP